MLCSISHLPFLTFLMLSNRCVFTCILYARENACIQTYHSLCSGHLRVWFASPSFSTEKLVSYTNVDWGGCPDTVDLLLVIVFFLVISYFHGLPRDNPHFLVPVQKLSTRALLMWFQKHVDSTTFSWSFIFPFLRLLWCIVTMLMLSTYQAILPASTY